MFSYLWSYNDFVVSFLSLHSFLASYLEWEDLATSFPAKAEEQQSLLSSFQCDTYIFHYAWCPPIQNTRNRGKEPQTFASMWKNHLTAPWREKGEVLGLWLFQLLPPSLNWVDSQLSLLLAWGFSFLGCAVREAYLLLSFQNFIAVDSSVFPIIRNLWLFKNFYCSFSELKRGSKMRYFVPSAIFTQK